MGSNLSCAINSCTCQPDQGPVQTRTAATDKEFKARAPNGKLLSNQIANALTAVYGVKLSPAHCASLLTETTRESNDSVTLDEFNALSEK